MFFSERGFINPETISSFYMNSTYIVYSQQKAIEVCKAYKKRMAEYCSTEIMAFIYGMKIFENERNKHVVVSICYCPSILNLTFRLMLESN